MAFSVRWKEKYKNKRSHNALAMVTQPQLWIKIATALVEKKKHTQNHWTDAEFALKWPKINRHTLYLNRQNDRWNSIYKNFFSCFCAHMCDSHAWDASRFFMPLYISTFCCVLKTKQNNSNYNNKKLTIHSFVSNECLVHFSPRAAFLCWLDIYSLVFPLIA